MVWSRPTQVRHPSTSLGVLVLMWALVTSAVTGQVVTGRVTNAVNGTSVGAGFIILLDLAGVERGRALTGLDGTFNLYAPFPGQFVVRSARIGYRPFNSPPLELAVGATQLVDLAITPLPIMLDAVSVDRGTGCQITEERQEVGLVWGEIRKALLGAQWTADLEWYQFALVRYRRQMNVSRSRILTEQTTRTAGYYRMPYRSLAAEVLADRGYIADSAGQIVYYAPDAEVLLHDTFQADHCFEIVRDAANPGLIGLGFVPIASKRLIDIEGVLWMDERSWELRNVEFQFTGHPSEIDDPRLGGDLRFERLPDGSWLVVEWEIRTPRMSTRTQTELGFWEREVLLTGFYDTGGKVMTVLTDDGVPVFEALPGYVEGVVLDRTREGPLVHAEVALAGGAYTATTDSSGRFRIIAPLWGEYGVTVSHPRVDALQAWPSALATVPVQPGQTVTVSLETLSIPEVTTMLCGRVRPGTRTVFGVVQDPSSEAAIAGVEVRGLWTGASDNTPANNPTFVSAVDSAGQYALCGLPLVGHLALTVESPDRSVAAGTIQFDLDSVAVNAGSGGEDDVTRIPWADVVWQQTLTIRPVDLEQQFLILSGTIHDAGPGTPLGNALIAIDGQLVAATDEAGDFRVTARIGEGGRVRVSVKRIGYAAQDTTVTVTESVDSMRLELALEPSGFVLPDILVEGEAVRPHLRSFHRRQAMGGGHFFTAEDIEKINPVLTTDILRRVPGFSMTEALTPSKSVRRIRFNRQGYGFGKASRECEPLTFIDGVRITRADFNSLVRPDRVAGIEVYTSPVQVPPEFSAGMMRTRDPESNHWVWVGSNCGVIVVWTK